MSSGTLYIERPGDNEPCECGGCVWKGTVGETTEVEDGVLNAGDPSPVGRCPDPDCGAFVYLTNDRNTREREAMLHALQTVERQLARSGFGERADGLYDDADRTLALIRQAIGAPRPMEPQPTMARYTVTLQVAPGNEPPAPQAVLAAMEVGIEGAPDELGFAHAGAFSVERQP